MLAPNPTQWETDAAFAREAFSALGNDVRCDPGELGPKPWQWLEVGHSGEAIVEWEEP